MSILIESLGTYAKEIDSGPAADSKNDTGVYYLSKDVKKEILNIGGILVFQGLIKPSIERRDLNIPHLEKSEGAGGTIVLRSDKSKNEDGQVKSAKVTFSPYEWHYSRATNQLGKNDDNARSHEIIKSNGGVISMDVYDHLAIMSAGPCPDGQLTFSSKESGDLPRIYQALNALLGQLSVYACDLRSDSLDVSQHFSQNIISYVK